MNIYLNYFNTFGIKSRTKNWHFEESRIKGGYNEDMMSPGVRAYIVNEDYNRLTRKNALIYSGIYNSRTGVNNTNNFNVGLNITKAVDSAYGGIHKLYAEETNLLIIQEQKTSQALIDKDAVYTAEGSPMQTQSNVVIGQIMPYQGRYGTLDPDSFANYAGRKYWVDRNRGAVLRLSRDGITEISNYGMNDFFRDAIRKSDRAVGMFDTHNKEYIISLQGNRLYNQQGKNYYTVAFDEMNLGWTTFYTFKPSYGDSLNNNFYTFEEPLTSTSAVDCTPYKHHILTGVVNTFYGTKVNSKVKFVANAQPSFVKFFNTINYEGDANWKVSSISTDTDTGYTIAKYGILQTTTDFTNSYFKNQFYKQDNKYFAWIKNVTTQGEGEILYGNNHEISGLKGFFATVEMENEANTKEELFAVGFNIEKIT
tara:strand:- start:315 stop:1586 length:1272 start_codon:yes stop_codon:yes gene_type:complete